MKNNRFKTEKLINYIILIIVYINGIFTFEESSLSTYFAFLLVFTLIIQTKNIFINKSSLFLLFLFGEIALCYYMHQNFGGLSNILIYITLIDGLIFLSYEVYIFSAIIIAFIIYFIKNQSVTLICSNIIVFFLIFISAKQIKSAIEVIEKTEVLYDSNRNYSYELEFAKKRLEDYAKIIEKTSQLEERNKISREIHDSVGHQLSCILLQLEAFIKIHDIDPKKSQNLLNSIKDNLRNCTQTLRYTVRGIKPKEYKNIMVLIHDMILNYEKSTGIAVDFNVIGTRYNLNSTVETAIYKNIQEALTNSVVHGKATRVNIDLRFHNNKIQLTISDNGSGCNIIKSGMGISGMEERVKILGGTLEFYSLNGFVIKTIIPINIRQVV